LIPQLRHHILVYWQGDYSWRCATQI